MRCTDLYVAGVAGWLPPPLDVAEAIAAGDYDATEQASNDYASVTVSDQAPPRMAALAAARALRRAGTAPADLALVLHASSWYQGVDFWPAASHVHRTVDAGPHAPAFDVQQMCNGVGVLELAAAHLAADPARTAVLVTVADRFAAPAFDRWRSDAPGLVYGDGAGALVLARSGPLRLLSVGTVTDTGLEEMYRAGEPFGPASGHAGQPVDIRSRRKAYRAGGPSQDEVIARTSAGLTSAVDAVLAEAGLSRAAVARWVFPNVGLLTLRTRYLEPLGLDLPAATWEWGRTTGHAGAADQFTGLAWLLDTHALRPGDHVLLVGIGAGFSWSCALLHLTP